MENIYFAVDVRDNGDITHRISPWERRYYFEDDRAAENCYTDARLQGLEATVYRVRENPERRKKVARR